MAGKARVIDRSTIEAMGGKEAFDRSVLRYIEQKEKHAGSEGTPAPSAYPLVEEVVDRFEGYEIAEPPEPKIPPKPSIEQQVIDGYQRMLVDHEIFARQISDMINLVNKIRADVDFLRNERDRITEIVDAAEPRLRRLDRLEAVMVAMQPKPGEP